MSVFSDEWRDCLKEHYKHVIRNQDEVTRPSLTKVLLNHIGFTEDELKYLQVEATLRTEDNPEDFVPDLDILTHDEVMAEAAPTVASDQIAPEFMPHPLECQCPQCVEINLIPHNEEGIPLEGEVLEEFLEEVAFEARKDDPDQPKQLSMF